MKRCPKCNSTYGFSMERSPNGQTRCQFCGYAAPHSQFLHDSDRHFLKIIHVESPYAGDDIGRNVHYARACMKHVLDQGHAPYVSHLLYTQPGVLRDHDPEERAKGIEAGLAFMRLADEVWVFDDFGVSSGMLKGIDRAREMGRTVVFKKLPLDDFVAIASHKRKPPPKRGL